MKWILFLVSKLWCMHTIAQNQGAATPQPFREPAEVLYVPNMNVDSLDKSSPVPRILFVPEQHRMEFIQSWGDKLFYSITTTILPDPLVEKMREKIKEKSNYLNEKLH
jgi:DNA-dependent RNA polymerase auxiliary subunit epsilon